MREVFWIGLISISVGVGLSYGAAEGFITFGSVCGFVLMLSVMAEM